MRNEFNLQGSIAEMIGSFIISFIVLLTYLITKSEKSMLDTKWKRRTFSAFVVPAAVVIGLAASRGLGGHGQANPAVTLLVAVGLYDVNGDFPAIETVTTIAFQLLGGLIAFGAFMISAYAWKREKELPNIFKFNNQRPMKTSGMELVGNIIWLLPIAGMLGYVARNNIAGQPDLGFWMLVMSAFFSKAVIVLVADEFGIGNYNPQVWFARMWVCFVANNWKITRRELSSELAGVITSLMCGAAAGAIYLGMTHTPKYI